jgi:hypothetical protein
MEVIFGVQAREGSLRLQIPDDEIAALRNKLDEALTGDGNKRLLWVTDKDGREYGIPSDKIAFVEFASEKTARTVGFSSAN